MLPSRKSAEIGARSRRARRVLVEQQEALDGLIREYRSARLSRREVMKRALALGASISAISAELIRSGAARAGTAAPDATTVVINLKQPYADLLNVVSTGYWAVVNTATRAKLGTNYSLKQIDGSGPFTFVEWVPGDHVSVKRWEDYPGSIVP